VALTIQQTLAQTATTIPNRESQLLLAHVLGKSREWVMAYAETEITPAQHQQFETLITRANAGEPLPYLLGHWEFFGLDFIVSPAVLIPRPETELLIERALAITSGQPRILDVGTGSGIIAVTLAAKLPTASITATDTSPAALGIAQQNAQKHGVADRITFIESDLLSSFVTQSGHSVFDLLTANLPYIPSADVNTLEVTKHEPRLALDGGPDGLDLIRRLLMDAPAILAPNGAVLLEIEYRQAPTVTAHAQTAFPNACITVHKDLAGFDRVVEVNHEH
jgi:release factor glutamine methyltransferase